MACRWVDARVQPAEKKKAWPEEASAVVLWSTEAACRRMIMTQLRHVPTDVLLVGICGAQRARPELPTIWVPGCRSWAGSAPRSRPRPRLGLLHELLNFPGHYLGTVVELHGCPPGVEFLSLSPTGQDHLDNHNRS